MLDENELRSLFPKAADAHIDTFLAHGDDLFEQFGLSETPTRQNYFLAQIGHESGGLTITEENLTYRAPRLRQVWQSRFKTLSAAEKCANNPEMLGNTVYANRMGNGPPNSGDGFHYRGRGYIQITGRDGYRKVGQIAGLDLVNHPERSAEPKNALLVACAFWQWKDINRICDTLNYVSVTRRINGGTNGLADRRAWLDKVRRVSGVAPGDRWDMETADIIELQRALQSAGYPEVGAADGVLGARSIAGIIRYRHEHGLPEGLIDGNLLAALGLPP
ncbi:MAG: glycoside hydrolase family 19 protein [Rhodospirillales bacterium]|nr:glycoside hydrolase family 19 protein [Rhodospirillales bacterium]